MMGNESLVRSGRVTVRLSALRYSPKTPVAFLQARKEGILENKLLSYCIALVHLPNKMKGLMWRRLQKTRWQTRPTRGCRYPAKRQIIYLTGKSRNYLKRGKGKEKKDKRSHHLLVTQAYVCGCSRRRVGKRVVTPQINCLKGGPNSNSINELMQTE